MSQDTYKGERQRTTLRLPQELYEQLRSEAFHARRDMNDIIVEQLGKRYTNDPLFFGPQPEAKAHGKPEVAQ